MNGRYDIKELVTLRSIFYFANIWTFRRPKLGVRNWFKSILIDRLFKIICRVETCHNNMYVYYQLVSICATKKNISYFLNS